MCIGNLHELRRVVSPVDCDRPRLARQGLLVTTGPRAGEGADRPSKDEKG